MNLYLDGILVDGPRLLNGSSTISSQSDKPCFGDSVGTSGYPAYGNYKGMVDELRIYGRGLTGLEVSQVYQGDFSNKGFLEFLAIDKPIVATRKPTGVLPSQAIMQVEVLSIGGEVTEYEETIDLTFKSDTIPGMQAWYNAGNTGSSLANGAVIENWQDTSGYGRDMGFTSGNPPFLQLR